MNIPDFAVTGLILITLMSFAVLVAVLVALKFSNKEDEQEVPAPPVDAQDNS